MPAEYCLRISMNENGSAFLCNAYTFRRCHQSPKFPVASTSVRPAVANWKFRGFVAVLVALGLSQSPVRRSGTRCHIPCAIQPSSLNVLGGTWKRISLPDIRDMSAILEVSPFHVIAPYKSKFTYTFLHLLENADFPVLHNHSLTLRCPTTWRRAFVLTHQTSLHPIYTTRRCGEQTILCSRIRSRYPSTVHYSASRLQR